jgi:DNA adenine methylase
MSYPGSKAQAGVWQRIIGQMPPHSTYVEPFFGSGQVFWRKRRAPTSILIDKRPDVFSAASAEAGASAMCGDALELLPALSPALPPDTVIYCDPPYVLSTRQGRFYYDHEMSDSEHGALLALLERLPCKILISGYPSKLYSDFFDSGPRAGRWRCVTYRTRTRGKTLAESLWCNFPEPIDLHDWRYAGQTFRQRLTLKRLAARWLKKLDAMPERKRGYVLDAIHQRHPAAAAAAISGVEGLGVPATTVKVFEHKSRGEASYTAKAYLGNVPIFTSQAGASPLHAIYDAQDWGARMGKALRFEQSFV